MEHPKVAGLPDAAFRLWVVGLSYCQKYLTDGFISDTALRGLRGFSAKRRTELEAAGLWESADGGAQVHDYLDWNDSRAHVLSAREQARERLKRHKEKRVSNAQRDAHLPVTCVGGDSQEFVEAGKEGGPGETKPPARLAFAGKVLEVPRFLDDEFVRRLNGHAFDLSGFYVALDARLAQTGESWDLRWIRDQFAAESPKPERRVERFDEDRPISAAERTKAERHRRSIGRCPHEPRCETAGSCIALIVRNWRAQEVA